MTTRAITVSAPVGARYIVPQGDTSNLTRVEVLRVLRFPGTPVSRPALSLATAVRLHA